MLGCERAVFKLPVEDVDVRQLKAHIAIQREIVLIFWFIIM